VIGKTPPDSYLAAFPNVHNAYIAGYVGFVELAKMAGPALRQGKYRIDRLLKLRVENFRWDVQADVGTGQADQYFYTFITAWNFMTLFQNWRTICGRMHYPRSRTLSIAIRAWLPIGWPATRGSAA